jgi:hypothetical protein
VSAAAGSLGSESTSEASIRSGFAGGGGGGGWEAGTPGITLRPAKIAAPGVTLSAGVTRTPEPSG